ncbi:hypothetical protein [Micromonospora rubida]
MDNSETVVIDRVGVDPAPTEPDGDLTAALAAAAPRRWWNRATLVLGALVLVLTGFLGGVQVQQRWGDPGPATAASGRSGGFPARLPSAAPGAGRGQSGAGTPSAAAGSTTTGTVQLVDGDALYVETADGTVVTVRTTDTTRVRTSRASKLTAIKKGQTVSVTVQGEAGADGAVTAATVTAEG